MTQSEDAKTKSQMVRTAVEQHERPLLRYAMQFGIDSERARDIVQDAFLQLWKQDVAELDGRVATWLFTVCRNRAIDVSRKEKRMRVIANDQLAATSSSREEPSAATERRDMVSHVQTLLENLSDNQREVVRLKFQAGLSYKEISRITELSVSNVGYLIHTAIRRLREQIQVDGAES